MTKMVPLITETNLDRSDGNYDILINALPCLSYENSAHDDDIDDTDDDNADHNDDNDDNDDTDDEDD